MLNDERKADSSVVQVLEERWWWWCREGEIVGNEVKLNYT